MIETQVIHEIFHTFKLKRPQKGFGRIGDDAVTLPAASSQDHLLLSTDTFTHGTHFDESTPVDSIGYKALVASISDIVAMGALPSFFMLNLTLPKDFKSIKPIILGLKKASDEYSLSLIGGDVVSGESLSLSIIAGGYQPQSQVLRNYGASACDLIFTDSHLGKALLGLEIHKSNSSVQFKETDDFVTDFLYPKINKELGLWLSKKSYITTLRDISDGLVSELRQFTKAHDLSVSLYKPELKENFKKACQDLSLDPLRVYFKGGEEYKLLWTIKSSLKTEFLEDYKKTFKTSPVLLGEVLKNKPKESAKIYFEPNQSLIDSIMPFEHFSS